MSEIYIEKIKEYFPQLSEVKDKTLVDATCKIWVEALNNSTWKNIEEAQFATRAPNVGLIKHTESVTENVLVIARNMIRKFGYDINTDTLIISAVLHDVCKLEEMEMDVGGPGTSKKSLTGKLYQHGFLSGYYCHKYGLPEEITALVVAHSGQSRVIPQGKEGMILFYADMMDADVHFVHVGTELCLHGK
ncbi:HD domain-containing protein [Pantoea ananatis]|uniref:HD domain-containing protein n=1 Tax=Pantoea ananas TaxID=553 RepID=UPI001B305D1E|nr:HD domain-containing protein [Pantoea ananatis]